MRNTPQTLLAFLAGLTLAHSHAHEGRGHGGGTEEKAFSVVSHANHGATTGQGDFRFRYNAELSELPGEIARGIQRAHGGFAITPGGEIYFGLDKTGLVRISPDLRTKTLIQSAGPMIEGNLHNTSFLDRRGGVLILADASLGRLIAVDTEGKLLEILGRPGAEIDPYYAKADNAYKPTDTAVGPDGKLYVVDGYSASKYVLAVDIERREYDRRVAGGRAKKGEAPPGKFSTCHGITWDPNDETLTIADRELHRFQKLKTTGEFVSEYGVDGANPCDIEFVDWQGGPMAVVPCLRGKGDSAGVVLLMHGEQIVATLKPKDDLGLEQFEHIHNAIGVVVDGKLHVLCYGWNPGCYAVLEHIAE